MRRQDIATNSRHCGDRTAITTARAWHDRSRRLTLFAPTCRSAPTTHTLYSARRMRSTLPFSSIVTRGRTGSATSEIFPDRALKPADATYPPFLGPFPPLQQIIAALEVTSHASRVAAALGVSFATVWRRRAEGNSVDGRPSRQPPS